MLVSLRLAKSIDADRVAAILISAQKTLLTDAASPRAD